MNRNALDIRILAAEKPIRRRKILGRAGFAFGWARLVGRRATRNRDITSKWGCFCGYTFIEKERTRMSLTQFAIVKAVHREADQTVNRRPILTPWMP